MHHPQLLGEQQQECERDMGKDSTDFQGIKRKVLVLDRYAILICYCNSSERSNYKPVKSARSKSNKNVRTIGRKD
jgi:hypothetical protein